MKMRHFRTVGWMEVRTMQMKFICPLHVCSGTFYCFHGSAVIQELLDQADSYRGICDSEEFTWCDAFQTTTVTMSILFHYSPRESFTILNWLLWSSCYSPTFTKQIYLLRPPWRRMNLNELYIVKKPRSPSLADSEEPVLLPTIHCMKIDVSGQSWKSTNTLTLSRAHERHCLHGTGEFSVFTCSLSEFIFPWLAL